MKAIIFDNLTTTAFSIKFSPRLKLGQNIPKTTQLENKKNVACVCCSDKVENMLYVHILGRGSEQLARRKQSRKPLDRSLVTASTASHSFGYSASIYTRYTLEPCHIVHCIPLFWILCITIQCNTLQYTAHYIL